MTESNDWKKFGSSMSSLIEGNTLHLCTVKTFCCSRLAQADGQTQRDLFKGLASGFDRLR